MFFDHAYYVSVDDYINVEILNKNFFVSNETLKTILDDNVDLGI